MEVCGVYIEKIENKGRALWVLGVFAREKEGTMPAHTGMRARAAAGGGGGRRRCRARVRVRVLAWFFLNQVPRAPSRQQLRTCWIAKGCEPDPLPPTVAYLLDCQRLRTSQLTAKGCKPIGQPIVMTVGSKGCKPFVWVRTCWPLLVGYIKGSEFSIKHTTTTPNFRINSLSL